MIPRALALALATVILALLLATPHVGTQAQDQIEVKIRWVTYINPGAGRYEDRAYGVCIFGDYVAVVGTAYDDYPYVALLRKSDGGKVKDWVGGRGIFFNCISIDGELYVVGEIYVGPPYAFIYVFNENLDVLRRIWGETDSGYR